MQINVEIIMKKHVSVSCNNSIVALVRSYLEKEKFIIPNTVISEFGPENNRILYNDVEAIIVDDIPYFKGEYIRFSDADIKWHVYTLDNYGPTVETDNDGEDGEVHLSTHLALPSKELFNLWESLHYDANIKEDLLQYAQTMMSFSDKGVDTNIVSCNRVILLHGPPGTGKTSLCKALAQKLTIRMQERFTSGLFVEINSHSLFSRWFSESGKLVAKMFSKIRQMVYDKKVLVCVLIDEIESLTRARDQCISGAEPSDSVRVVNAVLTQIDQIKQYPNVLIFATSNMTEAIDLAFVDRADIKQFLGLPSLEAIYKIYHSCLLELMKVKIISPEVSLAPRISAFKNGFLGANKAYDKLVEICEKSIGLSGRSLRKIPFIAHALFLSTPKTHLSDFLVAMSRAVEREKKERMYFNTFNED